MPHIGLRKGNCSSYSDLDYDEPVVRARDYPGPGVESARCCRRGVAIRGLDRRPVRRHLITEAILELYRKNGRFCSLFQHSPAKERIVQDVDDV